MKKRLIRDFALIASKTTEEEGDIVFTAQLKRWGEKNLNGEVYTEKSYANFIRDYYEEGGLNVPLTLNHQGSFDVNYVVGIVEKMESDEKGLNVTCRVFAQCITAHNKALIERGALQGVSDEGWATSWHEENNSIVMDDVQLLAVSIVTTPSEVSAGIKVKNTAFSGFDENEPQQPRKKKLSFLK